MRHEGEHSEKTVTGTWKKEEGEYVFSYRQEDFNVNVHFELLDGVATRRHEDVGPSLPHERQQGPIRKGTVELGVNGDDAEVHATHGG